MMEIVIGLNLGPVSRLTKMWESLPEKYQDIFDSLMSFTSTVCELEEKGEFDISFFKIMKYSPIFFSRWAISGIIGQTSKPQHPPAYPTWLFI